MTNRLILAWVVTSHAVLAANWYTSPTALSSGNGSLANPWPLQIALTNPASAIQPGDTFICAAAIIAARLFLL